MTVTVFTESLVQLRSPQEAYRRSFLALLARDAAMVRKNFRMFVLRTIMQPLLLVFVFTYVFPKIGQGVGNTARNANAASQFSTVLVECVVRLAIFLIGELSVA